jgi:hypothetical protein
MTKRQAVLVQPAALGFGVQAVVTPQAGKTPLRQSDEKKMWHVEVSDLRRIQHPHAAVVVLGSRLAVMFEQIGQLRQEIFEPEAARTFELLLDACGGEEGVNDRGKDGVLSAEC